MHIKPFHGFFGSPLAPSPWRALGGLGGRGFCSRPQPLLGSSHSVTGLSPEGNQGNSEQELTELGPMPQTTTAGDELGGGGQPHSPSGRLCPEPPEPPTQL